MADTPKTPQTRGTRKTIQYLTEAHATERALTRVLQEQIAVTPSGGYRSALETHLRETRDHATRVRARLTDLGVDAHPRQSVAALAASLIGQAVALAKTPLDLVRGTGGEEKVLKNAKDAAATEALEISTYLALERLATDLGDEQTARLAGEIRADEERMLDRILAEIPQLTGKVTAADVRGHGSYDPAKTGAGEAARAAADEVKHALLGDEPWPGYDEQTVPEVREALADADAEQVRAVVDYERRHKDRAGILQAIEAHTTNA